MRKLILILLGLGSSLSAMSSTYPISANLALSKPATAWSAGADNAPPSVVLTSPQAADYPRPSTITLTANASDSDGTIKQVAFYANGTLLNTDTSSPYTYNWNVSVAGVYNITAVATDNSGATTTSIARRLQVISNPPVVSVVSPVEQGTYTGPNVQIVVNASDPDGTVAQVEIYSSDFNSVLLTTLTAKPYTYTWTNVTPGTHAIFVRATDNSGRTASVRTTFTVLDPNNKAIPGRVEAESYDAQRGIATESTADTGGGKDVAYIDAGDYLDYKLTAAAGYYTAEFRVASWINNAQLEVQQLQGLEGVSTLATVTLPNTGGSQKWQTVSVPLPYGLSEGSLNLRLVARTNGFNLNWLNFVQQGGTAARTASLLAAPTHAPIELSAYPNPSTGLVHLAGAADGTAATVLDQLGRLVLYATVRNGAIDLSKLHAGSYFVSLRVEGQAVKLPLIKQ